MADGDPVKIDLAGNKITLLVEKVKEEDDKKKEGTKSTASKKTTFIEPLFCRDEELENYFDFIKSDDKIFPLFVNEYYNEIIEGYFLSIERVETRLEDVELYTKNHDHITVSNESTPAAKSTNIIKHHGTLIEIPTCHALPMVISKIFKTFTETVARTIP